MKIKLNKFEFISISIMLFGLFFGAGNLIFPPILGYNSGTETLTSFLFFSLTAILFPILGVIAVAKTDGLQNLTRRVHPTFALIYTLSIYLSIGPGLGIPRAGTVPFEMAISQYLSPDSNIMLIRLIYTFIFFLVAYLIALNPSKLVQRMGKLLTPVLIGFIVLLFIGVLFNNPSSISAPKGEYAKNAAVQGFVDGYNTLDAIASLNFGLIIAITIRRYKINNKKDILSYTTKAGFLAGFILLLVYAMLTFVGMQVSGLGTKFTNGAQILTFLSHHVYGRFGSTLVILIFTLACLTTSIGLIVSISEYFSTLTMKINETQWTAIITFFSFVVANFGLDSILSVSVPILITIYPFSLAIILMGVLEYKVKFSRASYVAAAITSFIIATVSVLQSQKIELPVVTALFNLLPMSDNGLNWILPTLIIVILTQLVTSKSKK